MENLILLKEDCSSKDELITKLLERIYSTNQTLPISLDEVSRIINLREKIGGTILPSGLSVPHARLKDFDGFVLALGTPGKVLYQEEIQIQMMSLMITSQSGGQYYLPVLAALTKISRHHEYFARLCGAESPAELISILREQDAELN